MAALPAEVVNTSGAGDCLVAGTLFGILRGCSPVEALAHGMVHNTLLLACFLRCRAKRQQRNLGCCAIVN